MTTEQIILFSIFAIVFLLFLWGRWRYDLVAFSALLVGVVSGVVPTKDAFSGFGHPATVVVALVLVVSAGLVKSGAVHLITRTLVDSTRGLAAHIAIMGGIGAVLSAFMNNVAALALLMPVDMQTARKAGRSPGLTLMPLSFATILGGMVTLIGTPPNIIIATFREQELGSPFLMFDFAPVGLVCALAGLFFVAVIGWRMIPTGNLTNKENSSYFELADYVAEMTVPENSTIIGQRIRDLDDETEKADVLIIGLIRGGRRLFGNIHDRVIKQGDALVIEASPDALDEFRTALKLVLGDSEADDKNLIAGAGQGLMEVVVRSDSRIAGKTALSLGLLWRHGVNLLGISRGGKRINKRIRRTTIKAGDILLLHGPSEELHEVAQWLGGLPLAERGLSITLNNKTWIAAGIFIGAISASSFGLVYLPIALGLVVALYVLTGIMPVREVYDHIEWPVVVLLGSMIPLGAALDNAGGTALIAGMIVDITKGMPAWAVLAVLMGVTMTLSDVLNNTATTIVAAPIALSIATSLGVSPDPFLMAVAVAASCAFLTPIGHKNNTLILGPGGYTFGDYWRMGLPLEIIILAVSIPAILVFWPL
ncbi:MAG: sodium-coupled transporter [Hyphomicrobiales bacterium]|nr:sodium-coupled transporter [Hyphomicrobiales bacterium]